MSAPPQEESWAEGEPDGQEEVLPLPPRSAEGEEEEAPAEPSIFEFRQNGEAERLDHFLCRQLPGRSRAFIQRLIEDGHVTMTPSPREVKPAVKVHPGTEVRLVIPPPRKVNLTPVDIPVGVVYEDEHLAVIDKPAGLAVHPAPDQSSHTLVNALLYRLSDLSSIGGEERPGIVHRLDKETSGVLLVAKNDFTHNALARQFKDRTIHKTYLAIVRGETPDWEGHIELSLGKSYTHTKKQMVRSDGSGREAVTDYRILEKYRGYALVEVYPRTGRTHQIRVHLASLRLPVACDKLYGREKRIFLSDLKDQEHSRDELPIIERQALHAASISFRHPVTREDLAFSAGLHADMHQLLKGLERFRNLSR